MSAPRLITATDLERWSDGRAAQGLLPQLVRLLVRATVTSPRRVDFRAGDSIGLPGWDGVVEAEVGNEWVPAGPSVWELGTGQDPRTKAERDYQKRTADPQGVDRSATAFVAVSSRRWRDKNQWAQEKQKEGTWREVRAYDADDLEQWCESAPSAQVWLCGVLGLPADGVSTLDDFWAAWAAGTEPRLDPPVVLAGRSEAAAALPAWLAGPPSVLTVSSESPEESVVFAVAALLSMKEEGAEQVRARAIVVSDFQAWNALLATRAGLVLIPSNAVDPAAVLLAASKGHHAVLPMHATPSTAAPAVRVPRLSAEDLTKELERVGFPRERAGDFARTSGRTALVLRRLLCGTPSVFEPAWAAAENARALVPALLAGSWDGANEHDRSIVERLGRRYADVLDTAMRWSSAPDPPLRRVREVWSWMSRDDAWRLLARFIARDDLEAFQQAALEVLGESNPRFDLPPDERWMAAVRGASPRYSNALRTGIAETLALLGARSEESGVPASLESEGRAGYVVATLLRGKGWRTWIELAGVLAHLAEAAPNRFLEAVGTLSDADSRTLFEQEEGMMGGAPHCYLLWALEMFAWHPEFLSQAALALARLARVDPGGRVSNRPLRSLRTIFLGWLPQTRASMEQRVHSLETTLRREPQVGWELVLELLPRFGGDSSMYIHKPRWRNWDAGWEHGATRREHAQWAQEVCRLALEYVGEDGARWAALVTHIAELPPEHLAALEARAPRFEESGGFAVWQALRDVLYHHRSYPEADWAMPADLLARLDAIYRSLEPADPIRRVAWLFTSWPHLPEPEGRSWRESEEARARARQSAAGELLTAGGLELILRVAREVERPFLLGWAIGARDDAESVEDELLRTTLCAEEASHRDFGLGFVAGRFSREEWEWADRTLEGRPVELGALGIARIACSLPFEPRTWDSVSRRGADVDQAYWREVNAHRLRHEEREIVERAISSLLGADRPYAALFIAGSAITHDTFECSLTPDLLARTLEIACQRDPRAERPGVYTGNVSYEIQHVLGALAKTGFDRNRVARLEWILLPLLEHGPYDPKVLYEELAANPGFFAEVVSVVFRSEDAAERSEPSTPEDAARAQRGYELLRAWDRIPGASADGTVDGEGLRGWVAEARRLCAEVRRLNVGDLMIGELLAKAPADLDGTWPHIAVREVIEEAASSEMRDGFRVAIFNQRGVYTKAMNEGGRQERGLAETYRGWAAALASKWPLTAATLRDVAAGYERDARREDEQADQD